MIAGKQRVFLQKREAQMIGAMPGRGDGLDRVTVALPALAVGEDCVRRIVAVMCGIEAGRAVAAGRERRGADHPRARRRAKLVCADAVVAMGVGDENGVDPLALDRGEQRRKMRIVARAWIDDRDLALRPRYRCRCR